METNRDREHEFDIVHRILTALSELPPTRRRDLVWELALAHGKPSWASVPADVWPDEEDPSDCDEGSFSLGWEDLADAA